MSDLFLTCARSTLLDRYESAPPVWPHGPDLRGTPSPYAMCDGVHDAIKVTISLEPDAETRAVIARVLAGRAEDATP